ncbi:hypothetical protein [Actinomadura gamaensis]|uniref:Polymerase nucleotidyl transferase domain-containing protein n=1 Tax=Actinomadura gamaensis TaxID=1763541 RepID=A0ABV9U8P6_9ACTN
MQLTAEIARWGHPLLDDDQLPACSMVVTSGGLLAAKITSLDGVLYGLVGYVADDGHQRAWGTWTSFLGGDWQRTLNLPYDKYAPLVTARQPDALVPELGRIARITADSIVATKSTQDPALLAEHGKVLDRLAAWCGIGRDRIGIYGSAMYKDPGCAADLDIVLYGASTCRRVHARAAGAIPPRPVDHPHHPHFWVPGHHTVLDPRYISGEHTITRALIRGDFTDQGHEPIDGLWVLDATDGIFFPARYTLSDGSVLLSYRAGHSGWLHPGDELTGPALPVYQRDGVRYRVVLRSEHLHPRRTEHE